MLEQPFVQLLILLAAAVAVVGVFQRLHVPSSLGYLLVGVFSLFYVATTIIRQVVSGELRMQLGRQLMERTLSAIEGHVVVCGLGRMGRIVCQEFSGMEMPFVVIDRDTALVEQWLIARGFVLSKTHDEEAEVVAHA